MDRWRQILLGASTLGLIFCCSAAAAGDGVIYRAGRPSKPPFAVVSVAHRVVLKVRWAFRLPCANAYPTPASGTNTIRAKIGRHGRFAETISYTSSGSDITTSFSGMITSKIATVRVKDAEAIPHYGYCSGSHTFKAARS